MPTPPRRDLVENPDFWADLATDKTNDALVRKWGCSAGYVSKSRKALREGKVSSTAPATSSLKYEVRRDADGSVHFEHVRDRAITLADAREWLRHSGDNPELFDISVRSIAYGGDLFSNKMSATPKKGIEAAFLHSLPCLYAEAERARPVNHGNKVLQVAEAALVVVLADWQIGKTGRRGGTPELLQRLESARTKLHIELINRTYDRILILDGGDGIEGFESGGNPMFTNDLSLPDQLDAYATEMFKFVELCAPYAPTKVGVVPSNHAAWRRGKQNLGRPADDFGIHVHKQVRKVAEAAGLRVTWEFPAEYDESLCIEVCGVPIGLVHGNQFGPGKAIDWWEGQAFGSQAAARADVLVTAHYHSFGSGVAGINPATGRERMWLGAPTEDNGSDWYRNVKGRDSNTGTLIFEVTEHGFDLGSLTIL